MSKPCTRCRNYGINEHHHGRIVGTDSDLCDVCYWRKRAEALMPTKRVSLEKAVAKMRAIPTDWHDMDDPQGELKKLRD